MVVRQRVYYCVDAVLAPARAWFLQGVAQSENKQYTETEIAFRQALRFDDTRSQAEVWLRYLNARSGQSS